MADSPASHLADEATDPDSSGAIHGAPRGTKEQEEMKGEPAIATSEPMREELVQSAVSFLKHPKVVASSDVQRRSFLENKGLTVDEIEEAFRRLLSPPSNSTSSDTCKSQGVSDRSCRVTQEAKISIECVPFVGFEAYAQMKFVKGLKKSAKLKYEEASQLATDAVGGIRTVASFCAEQKVMDAYEKKCESPTRQGMREGVVGGLGMGFSFLVFYLTYALCFYVGAKFVQEGTATFAEVFRVFFVLVMACGAISRTSAIGSDSTLANESAISVFAILDCKSKIDSSSKEGLVVASVRGDIEFQNVCFSYPIRPNVQILNDLSFSIPSGKTAALVGESGSGKSTAIALLERFYDPSSGKILFDSVELRNLKVSWLRLQIGLVAQEPVLFNDTIRANIAYGKQGEATEEEIVGAAEAANAHNFISGLPNGYDTVVGERGIQLSGGQKQRVAIARAVVKDPKVLLLDEATSALDAESERVVQEALDRVTVGRTTVVVAHRLSTIKGADIICIFESGTIVEKGRHDELMQIRDGVYASLVRSSTS